MPAVKGRKQSVSTILKETYFNARNPASFGGINKLAKATSIHPIKVQKWLSQQKTYQYHKPTRQKFPWRKYVARGVNEQWQGDLVEMQHYSRENQGYRYILCVIDIFSRFSYARPLKTKSGPDVAVAIQSIFEECNETPKYLQTDQGLEFYNQHVKSVLEKYNVELFSVYSDKKAAIVERFQRTLQERMYRAFTYQGNHKWLDLLPKLIESYNHSYHRSIKTMPASVKKENETNVWLKQYSDLKTGDESKVKFKLGDTVRIPKQKTVFTKGYIEKWTEELFTIEAINTKYTPTLYTLKDMNDKLIRGSFYDYELQHVSNPSELYRIEKVLRRRIKNNVKQSLVKWEGYKTPSWVNTADIDII